MLQHIRRSLALKLILASAIPSAAVLMVGLWVLIEHTQRVFLQSPLLAFQQLREGALLGSLLTLTFAAIAIALTTRRLLIKPAQDLMRVMGRAEHGEFLVRAKVESEDELGRVARSFNTMLAHITDLAIEGIEQQRSMEAMQREIDLQQELQGANERLADNVREMELVLDVTSALSGTLDLPEQLEQLGRHVCARLLVNEFGVMLVDESTHQLVVEAISGAAPRSTRGVRFYVGEGIAGLVAAQGQTIYVPDVDKDERYLHYKGKARSVGSFLAVPLRAKGRIAGVMVLHRPEVNAFSPAEIRLAEAIAAQAALAISNARLYAQMMELSYTDALTGIPNRRQLFQRLEQEWTRSLRFGDELSLLMIDLDLFKQVNDTYGHSIGDGILRGVALVLRRNVRKVDTVARYGGEEFCIVLPRVARTEAFEVAEKLRRAVAATPHPGNPGEPPLRVTVSIGVASYGVDATDVAALVERADLALYEAKRSGRNAVSGAQSPRAAAN